MEKSVVRSTTTTQKGKDYESSGTGLVVHDPVEEPQQHLRVPLFDAVRLGKIQ